MRKQINVHVIEDNEYYSNLLSNAIQQSLNPLLTKGNYQLVLRSFTNAAEYMRKLKSGELVCDRPAVFIDYYLGDGLYAGEVIELLKQKAADAMVVLISQDKELKDKTGHINYDYFVVKDRFAPALCGLYLRQYVENKYSVSLDQ